MPDLRPFLVRAPLEALSRTGLHRPAARRFGVRGVVFMLHHVRPASPAGVDFAPNRSLSVTPDHLAEIIALITRLGYETIPIGTLARSLADPAAGKFAVFTLDDGYRDNLVHACPVFEAMNCPFTIYVPSSWPDGGGLLWWQVIEEIVRKRELIADGRGGSASIPCSTAAEKARAFSLLDRWITGLHPETLVEQVHALAESNGIDVEEICRRESLNWDEIRAIAAHPLATIGSHTVNHSMLSRLAPEMLKAELELSRERLEAELDQPIRHLAYPYGDAAAAGPREFAAARDAGYETAVTTRSGPLFGDHGECLLALPRINLRGDRTDPNHLEVMLSGFIPYLRNGFQKIGAGVRTSPISNRVSGAGWLNRSLRAIRTSRQGWQKT